MGSAKSLIIGAVGVAVLVALVLLFMKVSDSPAHEIDDAKLQRAQASYKREQAAADRAPPTLPQEIAPRLEPRIPDDEVEEPEPAPVALANRPSLPKARRDPRIVPGIQAFKVAPAALGGDDGTGGRGLREQMSGANKKYDRADYEGAREAALEVLEDHPNQVRMIRIVVSSSCIMGDHEVAEEYFDKLKRERDRDQMARRCGRYGVELEP